MKKLLAVAVATAISAPAMADLTIGGNAEYNLKNIDGGSSDGTTSALETNLTVTGTSTSESGVTLTVFTELEATAAGSTAIVADDLYMEISTATAGVKLGDFGLNTAFSHGADMAQPTATVSGFDADSEDDPEDAADVALTFDLSGVTVQYATSIETADTETSNLYVGGSFGGVDLAANYQKVEGTDALTGFAVSAGTSFEGVAVKASYAKSETDVTTVNFNGSYMGLSLAVETNDAGATDATTYYGAYSIGDLGIPGAAFTVGAGGGDTAGDVVAARINYTF
jgi:hypothetical protein